MLKMVAGALIAVTLLFGPGAAMIAVGVVANPNLLESELCSNSSLTVTGITPDRLTATTTAGVAVSLDQKQLDHAATIITVGGKTDGVGTNGVLVALMAALTESGLRMLANTTTYPESANYPHDGDGSDHDSLGLFQMRPAAGWGSVAQLMDANYQAAAFYGGASGPNHGAPRGLLDIPGWQSLPLGAAAQSVEVSAYPDRYASYEPVARSILAALTGASGNGAEGAPSFCAGVSGDPQQLAEALMAAHAKGTFTDSVPEMMSKEIQATADGTVSAKCQIDTRILQTLVLTLNHFGSVGISDLGRPCVGSTLDCPSSPHCATPDLAVDFISVGGHALDGSDMADLSLLTYLDQVLPNGSWAGQSECRTATGDPIQLTHLGQFPDACTHQHIDIRGAGSSALTP